MQIKSWWNRVWLLKCLLLIEELTTVVLLFIDSSCVKERPWIGLGIEIGCVLHRPIGVPSPCRQAVPVYSVSAPFALSIYSRRTSHSNRPTETFASGVWGLGSASKDGSRCERWIKTWYISLLAVVWQLLDDRLIGHHELRPLVGPVNRS